MPKRTATCQDCDVTFEAGERGVLPRRCPDCGYRFRRGQMIAWKQANPDRVAAHEAKAAPAKKLKNAAWREANPTYRQEHYQQNRQQYIDRAAAWCAANPERAQQAKNGWDRRNPQQRVARQQLRRARIAAAPAEFVTLAMVIEKHGPVCGICGESVDLELKHPHRLSPSMDHIVPLARNGAHLLANLQLAHLACNTRKGARIA